MKHLIDTINEANIDRLERKYREFCRMCKVYDPEVDPSDIQVRKTSKGNWAVYSGARRIFIASNHILDDDIIASKNIKPYKTTDSFGDYWELKSILYGVNDDSKDIMKTFNISSLKKTVDALDDDYIQNHLNHRFISTSDYAPQLGYIINLIISNVNLVWMSEGSEMIDTEALQKQLIHTLEPFCDKKHELEIEVRQYNYDTLSIRIWKYVDGEKWIGNNSIVLEFKRI